MHAIPERGPASESDTELYRLMPLRFFYARQGKELPEIRFIDGAAMSEPQRSLLVHDRDMTPTLADFHEAALGLTVLEKEVSDDYLIRLVTLDTVSDGKVVEFGAIGIRLEALDNPLRQLILDCEQPLGGILRDEAVPHSSKPDGFFEVYADELISSTLREPVGARLFGRCNQLMDKEGMVFADVVEILPSEGTSEASDS